ncbi:MAG: hypothetical protein WD069_03035 [Planctomycetales bacterium]
MTTVSLRIAAAVAVSCVAAADAVRESTVELQRLWQPLVVTKDADPPAEALAATTAVAEAWRKEHRLQAHDGLDGPRPSTYHLGSHVAYSLGDAREKLVVTRFDEGGVSHSEQRDIAVVACMSVDGPIMLPVRSSIYKPPLFVWRSRRDGTLLVLLELIGPTFQGGASTGYALYAVQPGSRKVAQLVEVEYGEHILDRHAPTVTCLAGLEPRIRITIPDEVPLDFGTEGLQTDGKFNPAVVVEPHSRRHFEIVVRDPEAIFAP